MNKLYIIILVTLLIGCKQKKKTELILPNEQQVFIDSINNFCKKRAHERNAIKRKEIYDNYENWINSFSDSIVYVSNWKGKIKGIKITDATAYKATSIEFELEIPLRDDKIIEIGFEKYIPKGKENENLIYNHLKSIQSSKTVTFDGTFRITAKRKIKFGGQFGTWDNEGYNICNPHLEMNITSIKADSISDSSNLLKMKRFVAEQMRFTEMAANKEISNYEQGKKIKDIEKKKTELKGKLTENENKEVTYLGTELYLKISN